MKKVHLLGLSHNESGVSKWPTKARSFLMKSGIFHQPFNQNCYVYCIYLAEYVHNAGIRLRRQFRGHTRHPGGAASIVRACIEACWNGRTFTASPGHFDMFWTRDLAFSVPSLVRLGHGLRVHASLAYALDVWASGGATSRRRSTISIARAMSTSTASIRCRCSSRPCVPSMRPIWSSATAPWLQAEITHF